MGPCILTMLLYHVKLSLGRKQGFLGARDAASSAVGASFPQLGMSLLRSVKVVQPVKCKGTRTEVAGKSDSSAIVLIVAGLYFLP